MQGVIIIQGDKVKFRENETNIFYRVLWAYDVDGNTTANLNFKQGDEVEADVFNSGGVIIKFSPI